MAEHTAYLISPQGNRNLALEHAVRLAGTSQVEWNKDLAEAESIAVSKAKETHRTYWVHEVTTRTLSSHIPVTEVRSHSVNP